LRVAGSNNVPGAAGGIMVVGVGMVAFEQATNDAIDEIKINLFMKFICLYCILFQDIVAI
jgi:hypothetical protein